MSKSGDTPANRDLEDVRARLKSLNARMKALSSGEAGEARPVRYSPEELKDLSVEQMRNKLRIVNQYLRRKLLSESDAADEEAAPEPAKEPKIPKAAMVNKTTISESVGDRMVPDPDALAHAQPKEQATSISLPDIGDSSQKKATERLGVGLDLGTAYLVASREFEGGMVFVKADRNAFLRLNADQPTKELMEGLGIKYITTGNNIFVLGNLAFNLASIFNYEVLRTMSMGILNPSEAESIPVIKLITQNIIWSPRKDREICCFSIPANPIDRNQDTIYHQGVFEGILRSLGFDPIVIDEGYAVVLSELQYKNFTGIGVSCGAGMVNVCAAYKSVPLLSFSITRGGDWIDKSAATVLNMPISKVTTIKEQGINLKAPKSREEEAISIYCRNYIRYFLESMAKVFGGSKETPQFTDPVDIVFAGGSSMVGDFLEVVKEELRNVDLGLAIGEIKKSDEPFTSVARGCLFHAINSQAANV